ncbi:MAG: ABC transporter substrate-binding protein [Aquitalea sp.]|nr:ABC transporter substrate-binding protein [Aquitalea sp.]
MTVAFMLHTSAWAFSVTFISPGRHDEAYWLSATQAMQAAAEQLDIQLEVLYAERDAQQMLKLARQVAQRSHKPDYLLIVNEKLAAPAMLDIADQAGIPSFVSFNGLTDTQLQATGQPRQRLKHWLGSLSPDNTLAGTLTMQEVLDSATRHFPPGTPLHVLMVAGDRATPASVERVAGARQALATHPTAKLTQLVYGEWEHKRAMQQGLWLLQRYPEINVIWAANDEMAFGLEEAIRRNGKQAGRQVLLSAINNSRQAMNERAQGQLTALAAGHFMTGAWSLVMLYDYQHGRDFADEGLMLQPPIFSAMTTQQAQHFIQRFAQDNFRSIHFKQFSRVGNPALQHYAFRFSSLLN